MKLKKILSLVDLAAESLKVPDSVMIETMAIDKALYMQVDTLIPVFVYYANVLSINVYKKPIINISVIKTDNTLCYASLEEVEDDERESENADSVKILFLMESIHQLMGLDYTNKPDFTKLVKNWRRNLESLDSGSKISFTDDVSNLIIDNLPELNNKNDLDNRLN
jgi:hypothetical protein